MSKSEVSKLSKFLIGLVILFMPYIGLFLLFVKKPFSKKANMLSVVYCIFMCIFLFTIMSGQFNNKDADREVIADEQLTVVGEEDITQNDIIDGENKQNVTNEDSPVIEGFYRVQIEDAIEKMYSEGLRFSNLNYTQTDSMACGLWTCLNTFEGKVLKKEHSYTVRIGHNKNYNDGEPTMFYLSIDGETVFWDEENEDAFFEAAGM